MTPKQIKELASAWREWADIYGEESSGDTWGEAIKGAALLDALAELVEATKHHPFGTRHECPLCVMHRKVEAI